MSYGEVMTPEQLDLVAATASAVEAQPARFARVFYDHLFQARPEARALFPDDMTAQQAKLVGEVVFLAEVASDLDGFVERAQRLGARHHGYGVRFDHYDAVSEALLVALGDVLADDFTPAVEAAWTRLYLLVSETMLEGASGQAFSRALG